MGRQPLPPFKPLPGAKPMAAEVLVQAFTNAFRLDTAQGGCPDVSDPTTTAPASSLRVWSVDA